MYIGLLTTGTLHNVYGTGANERSLFSRYPDALYPDALTYYHNAYSPPFYSHTLDHFSQEELHDCVPPIWECLYDNRVTDDADVGQLSIQLKEEFDSLKALLGKRVLLSQQCFSQGDVLLL